MFPQDNNKRYKNSKQLSHAHTEHQQNIREYKHFEWFRKRNVNSMVIKLDTTYGKEFDRTHIHFSRSYLLRTDPRSKFNGERYHRWLETLCTAHDQRVGFNKMVLLHAKTKKAAGGDWTKLTLVDWDVSLQGGLSEQKAGLVRMALCSITPGSFCCVSDLGVECDLP